MGLQIINETYKKNNKSIHKFDLQKQITELRNDPDHIWYKEVHSDVLINVMDRLYLGLAAFFRGIKTGQNVGYPSFSRKNQYDSFTFKQHVKTVQNQKKIYLPKIGNIKAFISEPIIGNIKTCTIKREIDCWYACIVCEIEMEPNNQNTNIIGIDLGLIESIVTSDAEFVKNPKILNKYEESIKQLQRELSRKKKGSNNYNKLKNKLAKKHKKVRNVRTDYLHKLSTKIASENQVVIMEDLNIKNMVKNHKLAKSIHDAAWGRLVSMIEYKCNWQGKTFLLVNPRNTTTDCNVCHHRNKSLTLADRTWICEKCGTEHQRDLNASLMVLSRGTTILKESGYDFSTFKYAREISSSIKDGEPKNQLENSNISF